MWRDCFSTFEFVEWTSEHLSGLQFISFEFWMLIISLIHTKIVAWRVKFHECTQINSKFMPTYNLCDIFAWMHIEYARNMVCCLRFGIRIFSNELAFKLNTICHWIQKKLLWPAWKHSVFCLFVTKDCTWNGFLITSRKTDFNGSKWIRKRVFWKNH